MLIRSDSPHCHLLISPAGQPNEEALGLILIHGGRRAGRGVGIIIGSQEFILKFAAVTTHMLRRLDVPEDISDSGMGHDTGISTRADIEPAQVVKQVLVGKEAMEINHRIRAVIGISSIIVGLTIGYNITLRKIFQ